MNKAVITPVQLIMMAVGSALMFPYTVMPILNTPPQNQDVWIVLLIAIVYVAIFSVPSLIIINKFRGFSLNEMAEMIMGKVLGKVVLLLFSIVFIICFCNCMLIAVIFASISVFPETPSWAFLVFMLGPISYASYKGAGTVARLATFIIPFVMFTVIVFFLMGINLMELRVLLPIFQDSSLIDLNKGAFFTAARFTEILIFLVFSFFLGQKVSINKIYTKALIIFAVFYLLILLPTILVLGIDKAQNAFNPYFIFTRQVYGFAFIERVQALNLLAWFPGALMKLIIYSFMASYLLSGVFKTNNHKGFVIPISIFGFIYCLIPWVNKSDIILLLVSDKVFPWMILPFSFGVPLVPCAGIYNKKKED